MDGSVDSRIDGPHLPTTVGHELPAKLREIESAVNSFVIAAEDFRATPSPASAGRVWGTSRLAWNLLLPHRDQLLHSDRSVVERFHAVVEQLRSSLADSPNADDEAFGRLAMDLTRRSSLLAALLTDDREHRIRELLTGARPDQGGQAR
jgi:hypothetical protein